VTEGQWGHRVALIPRDWVLIRRGHEDTDAHRGTTLWGHRGERAATSQGQKGREEPASDLDLDSSLQDLTSDPWPPRERVTTCLRWTSVPKCRSLSGHGQPRSDVSFCPVGTVELSQPSPSPGPPQCPLQKKNRVMSSHILRLDLGCPQSVLCGRRGPQGSRVMVGGTLRGEGIVRGLTSSVDSSID
jgi:hypothetical protein